MEVSAKQVEILAKQRKIVKALLSLGADADLQDSNGNTALMLAAGNNNDSIVKILAPQSERNKRDKWGNTALMRAILHQYFDVAKTLVRCSTDFNIKNCEGKTALDLIAELEPKKASELINVQDKNGYTPLMRAILTKDVILAIKLLKLRADVNIKDPQGDTALTLAAQLGLQEVVELLLKTGAEVNVQNNNKSTALIKAARNGHTPVVEFLIQEGADTEKVNKMKHTALTAAVARNHPDTTHALLKHGANPWEVPKRLPGLDLAGGDKDLFDVIKIVQEHVFHTPEWPSSVVSRGKRSRSEVGSSEEKEGSPPIKARRVDGGGRGME
jgi:ankyrin repeat protein